MDNNIVSLILNHLPDDLKVDEFLNNLENEIADYFNGRALGKIRVCESLYNELIAKYDWIESNLETTTHESNLFYAFIVSKKGTLDFRVKRVNDDYKIVIGILDNVTSIRTTVNYYKELLISKVEIIKTKSLNNMDVYYDYDVYYYNAQNKLIPRTKYLKKEKIKNFMIEFGVSEYEAIFGIMNFEKYYEYFNQKKSVAIMEFCDENFIEDKKIFTSPFNLDSFELFQIDNNLDRINSIKEPLISQIGNDGELVVSSNIYQNIYSYLMNLTSSISTNGFIIKKVNDVYTLYYVNIKENNLLVIPKILTLEELKAIYYNNPKNEEIDGLKEFLGISRSL